MSWNKVEAREPRESERVMADGKRGAVRARGEISPSPLSIYLSHSLSLSLTVNVDARVCGAKRRAGEMCGFGRCMA
jgi:hypothetical protein